MTPFGPAAAALGSGATPFVVGTGAWGGAPASGTGGNGWPTLAPGATSPTNEAASGPGGPGSTSPLSGGTGDCNITVTDLTIPLSVRCTTGDSGSASGTGNGGDSGGVVGVAPSGADGRGATAAAVSSFEDSGIATGSPGDASSSTVEGTKGNCVLDTTNSFAALSVSCSPGTVGMAEASVGGGNPGPAGVTGVPGVAGGSGADGQRGDWPGLAASGTGGSAATTVTTGRTGNCIIHLVNIRAALTVVCITGSSGPADGASSGGRSGSATLLAAGTSGVGASGDSNGAATSGTGGNAIAVISSGSTGSCIIFLVNVMASVTVLCITGNSGPASGTAGGGASGSALLLATTGTGDGTAGGSHARAASGSGGGSSAVVTSGGTGNCVISLTNVWGSISLLCHTGNSGSALGRAIGGDSGSALVMLKAPSTSPVAAPVGVGSPFGSFPSAPSWHGGSAGSPSRPGVRSFGAVALVAERTIASPSEAAPSGARPPSPASNLAATGLWTPVPLKLAAGLMLSGGLGVATTTRRRRRFRQH